MKKVMCVIVLLSALVPVCLGADEGVYRKQLDALNADGLYDVLPSGAEDLEITCDISFNKGLGTIFKKLRTQMGDVFSEGMRCIVRVVAVSMICVAISAIMPNDADGISKLTVSVVGATAICAAALGSVTSVMAMGQDVISGIETFSKALLPTVAAAEAACGMPGSAIAKSSAAVLFSDILITLVKNVLMPLVYISIFAATANAAAGNSALRRIGDITAKVVSGSLKILLGAYVSYITVVGIISGGADRAGVKTAQLAVGSVPVVGGIMSGAAETVFAGAGIVKNAIGVFGLLTVLSAISVPAVTISINYMTFKAASVFAVPMIDDSASELCDRLGQSFGLILAMVCSCALVIFIAIVAALKSSGVG